MTTQLDPDMEDKVKTLRKFIQQSYKTVMDAVKASGSSNMQPMMDLTLDDSDDEDDTASAAAAGGKSAKKSSRIVVTIFMGNFDPKSMYRMLKPLVAETKYMVLGVERCPTTYKWHYQCFFVFNTHHVHSYYRKLMPRVNIQFANGTNKQASDYCKSVEEGKTLFFTEIGELPDDEVKGRQKGGQATKDKWAAHLELVKSGRMEEISWTDPEFFMRNFGTLLKVQTYYCPNNTADPNSWLSQMPGIFAYGPSGCGKSCSVRIDFGPDIYDKSANKWSDGANECKTWLIEELEPEHLLHSFHFIKKWLELIPVRE